LAGFIYFTNYLSYLYSLDFSGDYLSYLYTLQTNLSSTFTVNFNLIGDLTMQ